MERTDSGYEGTRVEVEIITATYRIRGTVFVPSTGQAAYTYATRLSDLLNNADKQFIALTDVVAEALADANEKWQAPFFAVNKDVVTMVREISK